MQQTNKDYEELQKVISFGEEITKTLKPDTFFNLTRMICRDAMKNGSYQIIIGKRGEGYNYYWNNRKNEVNK